MNIARRNDPRAVRLGENALADAQQNKADIEYISMMVDVDLETDAEDVGGMADAQ